MDERLVKVTAIIPAEPGEISRESMWAVALGDDRFELRNTPWFAYGLSWGDVVRCADDDGGLPVIQEVVKASGRRTLRLFFNEEKVEEQEQRDILAALSEFGASYERATSDFLALDFDPSAGDYGELCRQLGALEEQEKLSYEEAWAGYDAVIERGFPDFMEADA